MSEDNSNSMADVVGIDPGKKARAQAKLFAKLPDDERGALLASRPDLAKMFTDLDLQKKEKGEKSGESDKYKVSAAYESFMAFYVACKNRADENYLKAAYEVFKGRIEHGIAVEDSGSVEDMLQNLSEMASMCVGEDYRALVFFLRLIDQVLSAEIVFDCVILNYVFDL